MEVAAHLTRWPFTVDGSWTLQDVHLRDGHHGLDGHHPPQVPDQHGALRLAWRHPSGVEAASEVRYLGRQYDDDRNRHPLGGVALLNAHLGWRVSPHLEVFLDGENLADRTVPVGRSDVTTIGAPRLVHGGMTLRF